MQAFWEALAAKLDTLIAGLWVVLLAAWGGAIRYHGSRPELFSWWALAWEMSTSAFVGVVVYLACSASGFSVLLTAAIVGVAGHIGASAMQAVGKFIFGRAGIDHSGPNQ